jgi:DNA polymerase III alpha subunit (gram-positive type)
MSADHGLNTWQLKVLIMIPIIVTPIMVYLEPATISALEAVPKGVAAIGVEKDENGLLWANKIEEYQSTSVEFVIFNSSPVEDLVKCPGIGQKLAETIVKEREYRKFISWYDLQTRIKNLSESKIQNLKDLGVKLNP